MGSQWLRFFLLALGWSGAATAAQDFGTDRAVETNDDISEFENEEPAYGPTGLGDEVIKLSATHYYHRPPKQGPKRYDDDILPVEVEYVPGQLSNEEVSAKEEVKDDAKNIAGRHRIAGVKSVIWGIIILLVATLQLGLPKDNSVEEVSFTMIGVGLSVLVSGLAALAVSIRQAARGGGNGAAPLRVRGLGVLIVALAVLIFHQWNGPAGAIEDAGAGSLLGFGIFIGSLGLLIGMTTQYADHFIQHRGSYREFLGVLAPAHSGPAAKKETDAEEMPQAVASGARGMM